MKALRLVKQSLLALTANKLRTFFMLAGTLIGVTALTAIITVSTSADQEIQKQVAKFGLETIKVNAGGARGYALPQDQVVTLTLDDAEAIWTHIDGLKMITSVAEDRDISIRRGGRQITGNVFAIEPGWHEVMDWYVGEGEAFDQDDINSMARVIILGDIIRQELFGDENPIGQTVQVGEVQFQVKGLLEARGAGPSGRSSDDRVLIPLTTGLRRLFNRESISYTRMLVEDPKQLRETTEEVRSLLRERHHLTQGEEDDFSIVSASVVYDAVRPISKTLEVLLVLLAGLSLIVGGVVLANIMLISVSERVREIGLRRSVGATRKDIFAQFLWESLGTTSIGAIAGVLLGGLAGSLITRMGEHAVTLSWGLSGLAVLAALLIGTLCGVIPARRAARISPAEALR